MEKELTAKATMAFAREVKEGLTAFPKYLSSKYFYDERGDALFQKIMTMPDYYLTDAEFEILDTHKEAISTYFSDDQSNFDLFELGAGDGKKTKILLKHFLNSEVDFSYRPIDISQNALDQLQNKLLTELPNLKVNTLQGTYFDTLKDIGQQQDRRKVILFLGSNIGNLLHLNAIDFLKQLNNVMQDDDLLFMGMDQKKNPQTILNAYNDSSGITEAFNKNILHRINTELGGNFDVNAFSHWEVYDPETGTAKSYLIANSQQQVEIDDLQLSISFDPWETIHTEISQKYDDETAAWLAKEAGLQIITSFNDSNNLFKNYILKKASI